MSDLISRSALAMAMGVENAVKYGNETAEQQHNSYDTLMKYEIADYIDDAPAVDAVEVVRCRECVYAWKAMMTGTLYCELYGRKAFTVHPDGYCSRGAKKDGGAEEC